ncbi:hypothetical protein [Streptomyces cyaneofuscatus]|uniref:hypothetical protein n=1 Tax=Streptomyces cyaneofuscatus TaxID=66883 RepID=UPI00365A2083
MIALTRMTPPDGTGLSHWSTRESAKYLKRTEGISVSWHYIARFWREERLKPHRNGTFKISKDPAFAETVTDVIGPYLAPPGGAVVLSIDEKTQIQALDRTQPVLPVAFEASEKRTPDYVRHGTQPVRRPERDHRRSARRVQEDPERPGLPGLLEEGRQTTRREAHHIHVGGGSTWPFRRQAG